MCLFVLPPSSSSSSLHMSHDKQVDASYLEVYNEQISDLLCQPVVEEDFVPLKPKERIKLEEKLKKLLKVYIPYEIMRGSIGYSYIILNRLNSDYINNILSYIFCLYI